MSINAESYYQSNPSSMKMVRAAMPDVIKGFGALHQAAMKSGALTGREKELIALSIAVAIRCENCIYAHVEACLKAGATREQILDAAGVAVMMQGGPSYTYLPRVFEALEALSKQSAQ